MYARALIVLVSAAAAFAQSLTINTPQDVQACTDKTITWSGGSGPYKLLVQPGGSNSANADAALETHTDIISTSYTWHVTEDPGTEVFLRLLDSNNANSESDTFTIQASAQCPDACSNHGSIQVPQKPTPSIFQCNSRDTGITVDSASSCAGLEYDGSSIYTSSSAPPLCCDNIPAGTFVCKSPPPCTQFFPTMPNAESTCLVGDVMTSVSSPVSCQDAAFFLETSLENLYTLAGNTNICCDSLPVGTTVCIKPTSAPSSSSSSSTTTNTDNINDTTESPPSTPSNVSGYKDWTYLDCYIDSAASRVLPFPMSIENVTIEKCLDACRGAGFLFAGLEFSYECYCGRKLPPTIARDGRCNKTCRGNSQQLCGGQAGLSVYHSGVMPEVLNSYNMYDYQGCYEDSVGDRTMFHEITSIGREFMTVERCIDACFVYGFAFAGLEWSDECWCAQAPPPIPVTDGRCDMVCKGNPREFCGGGNGLSVYMYSYIPRKKRAIDSKY